MSRAVDLYRFASGADVWTLTSADEDVVHAEESYVRESVKRGEIEQSGDINRARIKITLPRTNTLAQLLLTTVPDYAVTVTIFRHSAEETAVAWKGRIAGTSAGGSEVTLECESVFTSLRRPGLRARYQRQCRHTLYGRGCTLVSADFAVPATCTAAVGESITVTEAEAQPDGWYIGGMCEHGGILRAIVDHRGASLTLSRSLDDLVAEVDAEGDAAVAIYPGCDRLRQTCISKFDNVLNFGGFPWIPGKNPFGGKSII
jgi:uncharacterized phage protein (TIGR02218 family)